MSVMFCVLFTRSRCLDVDNNGTPVLRAGACFFPGNSRGTVQSYWVALFVWDR